MVPKIIIIKIGSNLCFILMELSIVFFYLITSDQLSEDRKQRTEDRKKNLCIGVDR